MSSARLSKRLYSRQLALNYYGKDDGWDKPSKDMCSVQLILTEKIPYNERKEVEPSSPIRVLSDIAYIYIITQRTQYENNYS